MTDNAGVLSGSDRAEVTSAINELYADRHIRLWVVYVDNFSGQSAMNWGQSTFRSSELGSYDALLAVATVAGPMSSWCRPPFQMSAPARLKSFAGIRSNPRCAAATGAVPLLRRQRTQQVAQFVGPGDIAGGSGVIVVAVVILLVVTRYRAPPAR
ncbi:repair family protein [Mycobacterium kansasii]|uniref:Repair family protein n=1 Tax=Mycobacterium kansasii TaxID=1768 RepID=A0A1V3XNJ7_MYCKA|nr:repair family protein [Mycobacterium kansasii]